MREHAIMGHVYCPILAGAIKRGLVVVRSAIYERLA
jgi:hypothetical protein